jgi:DNA-directed RNA polymerase subunit RPC12/RpoP
MEWRCEWCGKPHDENDPPCDNCGHGTFEKAVVPVADAGDELGSKSAVWVCTECGREHTKHTPPCSRCGNEKLVRERQEVSESELTAPGYLDLVTPKYVLGLVAVLGLGALFILGLAGVVPLPGFGNSVPSVSDVPGNAETVNDISLATVERTYLQNLDEARGMAGAENITRDDRLDEIAVFVNQRVVKTEYGDGEPPAGEQVRELLGGSCEDSPRVFSTTLDSRQFDSPVAIADAFASAAAEQGNIERGEKIGVDVHTAPGGTLYLMQFSC